MTTATWAAKTVTSRTSFSDSPPGLLAIEIFPTNRPSWKSGISVRL